MSIKEKIEKWVRETLETNEVVLVHPKELENGDYTLIINDSKAEEYFEKLKVKLIPEVKSLNFIAPRFINIYLSEQFFAESIKEINDQGEKFGETKLLEGKKIIIEYTNTNVLKPMHIGHLMGNVIGQAISNIIEINGAEVKRNTYQGDVGLHVAKAVWGIKKMTDQGVNKGTTISDNANFIGVAYERGSANYDLGGIEKKEIIEINQKLYRKDDPVINEIYRWGKEISLAHFDDLYKKLNTVFDFKFFESEISDDAIKIVNKFKEKGVFEESDGAIIFRGEKYNSKLHTRVFINNKGLPLYEAKDVAHSIRKESKYKSDKSIIVTANEQNEYFKVVLKALEQIESEVAKKTTHLSHGMLKLSTGKMSSRSGNIITGEALIRDVSNRIKLEIQNRGFSDQEKENIAEIVSIGAIKYSILRQAIGGDIVFDFDKSISFEGDSGPYLQYTVVRAKSVLEKAKNLTPGPSPRLGEGGEIPNNWEVTNLEKILYRFPEVVERAGREYAPHHLVTYLTELASAFNSFYGNEKIINEGDSSSAYKIALTEATAHVLKNGLHLLGIKVPERM